MDILASTSSIWNLCVISLDRYMAGQDPIGYRDKVSKRRILMAICCVWMVSACLSFPAILWWRNTSPHLYRYKNKCLFTDSAMYVGFSSLVSFYIPLCLILFAYGKVFIIATRHSRGMRMGMKKITPAKLTKIRYVPYQPRASYALHTNLSCFMNIVEKHSPALEAKRRFARGLINLGT
ncbi:unnamed protein product [Strongylus vulgaris]|uniref:G-protein coupled receptors family 1 profile domain-containing protein n=1 Tax=Strongylus vulgaris TaxID=40348 RepID=A0A3P7JUP6_STRVU|nr:unnamed protein product [Strongylus vulgaris]